MSKTKTYILGSCATRDAFEYEFSNEFILGDYTARTSFASLACNGKIDNNILSKIGSTFQKRMVLRDMEKSFWSSLSSYEPGVLIIDLVDDRFRLNLFSGNCANTVSAEYAKAAKASTTEPLEIVKNNSECYRSLWDIGVKRLFRAVEDRAGIRVFVNCVFYRSTGNSALDNLHNIEEMNGYLKNAYASLSNYFGEHSLITYPENILLVDPTHKWGLAPFHYQEKTYRYFIGELSRRLN